MTEPLSDAQFVEILTSSQVSLRSYALSLLRVASDADDVLQNACAVLWEKRRNYDSSRDFFPWACGVVLIEVLRHRRKKATEKLLFDETLINTLAAEYLKHSEELERRQELLHHCVSKLNDEDRQLLDERYQRNIKPKQIATQRGKPPTTIYSALARIREALFRCIETRSAHEAHPNKN